MANNTPISEQQTTRSNSDKTIKFFDAYGTEPLEFNASESDAVLGFFKKRGMGDEAARTVAFTVMKQAKVDGVKVQTLLDEIKDFDQVQLSDLLGEILNINRLKTSSLGTAKQPDENNTAKRNIVP